MKTLLKSVGIPFLLSSVFFVLSCSSSEPREVYKFEVVEEPLNFSASAGTANIPVAAQNVTWSASVNEESRSWLSVVEDIDAGTAKVSVTLNQDDEKREGTVIITPNGGGYSPVSIKVTQAGEGSSSDTFRVTPPNLEFEAEDNEPQTITVTVSEGLEWDFKVEEADKDWLFAELKGDSRIEVTVADNAGEEELNGKITVWLTNSETESVKTVSVSQKGNTGQAEPILRASQTQVTLPAELGQTRNVNVTAINVEWDLRIEEMTGNWFKVTKNQQGTQQRITLETLEANETHDPRTAKVILFGEGVEDLVIQVTQSGVPLPPIFEPETNFIVLQASADTYVINITAQSVKEVTEKWTYARSFKPPVEEWLTYTIADDLSSITLVATSNTTTTPRYAQIWMRSDDRSLDDVCIEVIQKDINGGTEIVDLTFDQISANYSDRYGSSFGVSLAVSTNGTAFTKPTGYQFGYDENVDARGFIANINFYTDRNVDSTNPKLPEGVYRSYETQSGNYYWAITTYNYSEGYNNSLKYFANDGDPITVTWSGENVKIVFDGQSRASGDIPTVFVYEGPWVLHQ